MPGGGIVAEVEEHIFEFCLPQWARDPVEGCEPLLRQQGLRLDETAYQDILQACSADGTFLPAKNEGLVPVSWKILQCCPHSALSSFTLLCEFTSCLRNLSCCLLLPGPTWVFRHFYWGGAEGLRPLLAGLKGGS